MALLAPKSLFITIWNSLFKEMILKNDNLGLLCGTFIGGLLGSIGTILVLKKLKKLEEKEFNKAESQAVNEVTEYYEKKLNELKNVKIFGDVSKLEKDKNLTKFFVLETRNN